MRHQSQEFYSELAHIYEQLFPPDGRTIRFLAGLLPDKRGAILDAGCGTGAHVRALLDAGYRAWGTDLSPQMIAVARDFDPAHADHYQVDGLGGIAEHPHAPVDLLVCIGNTLSHLETRDAVRQWLRSVPRAITPGGSVVVQTVEMESVPVGGRRELPVLTSQSAVMHRTYHRLSETNIAFEADIEVGSGPKGRTVSVTNSLLVLDPHAVADELRSSGLTGVRIRHGFVDDSEQVEPGSWVRVITARNGSER